jgi:hypothetical protein
LSELSVKISLEKALPVPFVNVIGMVFPELLTAPEAIPYVDQFKSDNEYTSIYPPVCNTEKLEPKVTALVTLSTFDNCCELIGFLYGNAIF